MAKNVICDTDVMIDFWDVAAKRHDSTREIVENVIRLDNVLLSVVTKMELLSGALNKRDLNRLNKKLTRFNISLLSEAISIKAVELLLKYRLSHGLTFPDALIAATAIVTGLELFTYNLKDFVFIQGLKLFTPNR
ncbi:type II toxin-antitoxin system VapC family toxin [Imperialibacter roseus]|uniref:Ribonuclease VapC n=1 Tax=Imperialibacter roseus TaxID=1324217 RepID=A0ABZ0IMC5_9BACT|nr:type II toxin-antitoxin system VapC family toxin [Imperialibacter roseus]WOK05696.1 type II toxin-antitoxin system VapC family toxin [Imperialibacter roseus]